MGLKAINVLLLIALSSQIVFAKPRDSTVIHDQSVVPINNEAFPPKDYTTEKYERPVPDVKIPGRISCEYEEATEDIVCQEHCLPKGYTYGICVRNTCSCI